MYDDLNHGTLFLQEQSGRSFEECRITTDGNLCNISLKRHVTPCKCAKEAIDDLNNCAIASRIYFLKNDVLESKASVFCKDKPSFHDLAAIIAEMMADLKAISLIVEKGDEIDG